MAFLKTFVIELFSVLSRLLNVLTGGSSDMSFSARSHRDGLWTEHYIDWLFLKLFREERHCQKWWDVEVARAADTVAKSAYMKASQ